MLKIHRQVKLTIHEDNNNPFLQGPFTPQSTEYTASSDSLQVIGEIPKDLHGVYVRNTHNQVHEPLGMYHPFDGDGLLHAAYFHDGVMEYRNRFVETTGFLAEMAAGKSLWPGLLEPYNYTRRGWGAIGAMKDNAGTDVIGHAGKVLAVMSQGSEPWRLDPITLENLGPEGNWAGKIPNGVGGEFKVDVRTGELMLFNYPEHPPYMNYGVVDIHNQLVHYEPIELPGARWPHDMGMTQNYCILHDLPFFFDSELLHKGVRKLEFHRDMPARFGVIPRHGRSKDVRWFEASPCFILHLANSYEDGDEIIMDGCISVDPAMPAVAHLEPTIDRIYAHLDKHRTRTRMHRWRFNLRTGETSEQLLDDEVTEFPTVPNYYKGYRYRYSYNSLFKKGDWLQKGIKKYDLDSGNSWRYEYGEGRYGGEVHTALRENATSEDDGYLVTFVVDMNEDRSECFIIDAHDIEAGPVARIILPERISIGTHACWIEGKRLQGEAADT